MSASVIDYVIANDLAREEIEKITEGIRTESDHAPLEVKVYGLIEMERKEQKKTIEIERSDWTEEGIKSYHEKCEGWKCTQSNTENLWREIEGKVKKAITKYKRKVITWRLGRRVWYNKEWKDKKRELRKKLRYLKKGKIERKEYIERRREYRE